MFNYFIYYIPYSLFPIPYSNEICFSTPELKELQGRIIYRQWIVQMRLHCIPLIMDTCA